MTIVFPCMAVWYIYRDTEQPQEKELHRTNQGSNFLGGRFSNKDNEEPQSNSEEKGNPSILKNDFSSRTDPSIFTSKAPVLSDRSDKTS